ncbi:hypothetical protein PAMC26577_01455 [Caballeronia sordidicola]|uniref:Uncharacterized protein n=1 Tax=Caballeronia sordidicola TaxID=196367 RepID=A0A242N824_CABSO|nr:hypothetical protein PAMC26577_01455 [Caballeronia sordidicola]
MASGAAMRQRTINPFSLPSVERGSQPQNVADFAHRRDLQASDLRNAEL